MEAQADQEQQIISDDTYRQIEKQHHRGKVIGGFIVVIVGSLFLAKELGAEIPEWIFTWKMLLISLGLISAVKHKFLHPGWIVLVGVGGIFLLNDLYPDMHIKPFIWPVLIILAGLFIMFKPRRKETEKMSNYWNRWHQRHHHGHGRRNWHRNPWEKHPWHEAYAEDVLRTETRNGEDYVESINFLGSLKKNVLSKKFKGGEVINIFGGANIDLSQADFEQSATLDITQVFGGTKLIVPANWEIKSDTITICGGIEDKRPLQPNLSGESQRVLKLIGTTVFGGIEIKSFN